jgi:hypothetical protein
MALSTNPHRLNYQTHNNVVGIDVIDRSNEPTNARTMVAECVCVAGGNPAADLLIPLLFLLPLCVLLPNRRLLVCLWGG